MTTKEQSTIDGFYNTELEPVTGAFLHSVRNDQEVFEMSLKQARHAAERAQKSYKNNLHAQMQDLVITHDKLGQIKVQIVRPERAAKTLPAVIYLHGGGWVLNNKITHNRLMVDLANGSGCAMVFVEYSRSPEAKFPIALEEAYAATQWIYDNHQTLDLTADFAIIGDSSGGNLAAAVCLLAIERKGPPIKLQVLLFPALDDNFNTASYHQYAEGYFLSRSLMKWFWDQYAPDEDSRQSFLATPLKAPIEKLQHMPRTLIISAEADVLRDEAEAFARKLTKAKVNVTAVRYLGTIHSFVVLNGLRYTPAAEAALDQVNAMLKRIFAHSL